MPRNEARRTYHRNYEKERYHRLMGEYIKRCGGCCATCGATERLELHHVDPTLKMASIAQLWSRNRALVDLELAKCVVLCKAHHDEETARLRPPLEHGTVGMYEKRRCRCGICRSFYAGWRLKYRPANVRGRRKRSAIV